MNTVLFAVALAAAIYSSYGSTPCTRTPLQTITVINDTVLTAIKEKIPEKSDYHPEIGHKIYFYLTYTNGATAMVMKTEENGATKYYDVSIKNGKAEYIVDVGDDIFFTALQENCKSISTEENNDEAPVTEEQANPDGNLPQ